MYRAFNGRLMQCRCMPTDSTRKPFDLWYYDQLMQQQDVIRLTIGQTNVAVTL